MDMYSLPLVRRAPAVLAAAALTVAGLAGATSPAAAATAAFCADGSQPMATVAEVEAFAADTPVSGLSVVQGTTPAAPCVRAGKPAAVTAAGLVDV